MSDSKNPGVNQLVDMAKALCEQLDDEQLCAFYTGLAVFAEKRSVVNVTVEGRDLLCIFGSFDGMRDLMDVLEKSGCPVMQCESGEDLQERAKALAGTDGQLPN
jgi:hypothetical protein